MGTLLEDHWAALKRRQKVDFRSANLHALVERHTVGSAILDVGCGTGGAVVHFASRGHSIKGIDISERMIEGAREALIEANLPDDLVSHEDVYGISDTFSTVLSLDVLEHVEDDRKLLKGMAERVARNGRLIVTVPAVPFLFGPKDVALGHYRRYTKSSIQRAIAETGLRVIRIRYWNFIGIIPTFLSVKVRKKALDESWRYEARNQLGLLNKCLYEWFRHVENSFAFPIGLSILVVAGREP
jgi:SAM-dependent methyltransferase